MLTRLAFLAILISGPGLPAFADDWNQWRGPHRNGLASSSPSLIEKLPEEGLMRQWKSEAIPSGFEGGWSSPVVAGGKVFLYSHAKTIKPGEKEPKRQFPWLAPDKRGHLTPQQYEEYEVNRRNEDEAIARLFEFTETLYAIDAETGQTAFKNVEASVYTRFVQSSTPAVSGGRVFVMGAARTARCYSQKDGAPLWTRRLPGEFRDEYFMSSFVVEGRSAVILCDGLYSLDAETGEILWSADPRQSSGTHTSPVIWTHGDRSFVLANANDGTACFDLKDGKLLWQVESGARQSTPLVTRTAGNDLLLTYGGSRRSGLRCYKITPAGAQELWTYNGAADEGSSPVVVGDQVYLQGGVKMACVNLLDGQERWNVTLSLENPRYTSPIAADNKVFYAFGGLLCVKADAASYQPLYFGQISDQGLLATEPVLRSKLALHTLDAKQAEQAWKNRVEKHGPMVATTPAYSDGRLFIRTADGVVCFRLTQEK